MERDEKNVFMEVGQEVTGPVLASFVAWILKYAVQEGIHTLYFLARDGYVLQKIAKDFAERFSLPINCRYLYCSRNSLRLPAYHLIGEEAYDLLFLGGYRVTLDTLLDRASLTDEQKKTIKRELILVKPPDQALSRQELSELAEQLRQNKWYRKYVDQNSRNAYPPALGYLKQEGLLDEEQVAIVDSGWTGSMQRSLRQLLESAGFSGRIIGFYFGMYAKPKEARDGTYLTWYFDAQRKALDKALFCNNLFECILSAPHGMTLSYRQEGSKFCPVMSAGPDAAEQERIMSQIDGILLGAMACAEVADWRSFGRIQAKREIKKRLHRFMAKPTPAEASVYGAFLFNDDVRDANRRELASQQQTAHLNACLVYQRLLRKMGKASPIQELFWPYGTIALLPKWKQAWYRWNVYAWEWLKYRLAR